MITGTGSSAMGGSPKSETSVRHESPTSLNGAGNKEKIVYKYMLQCRRIGGVIMAAGRRGVIFTVIVRVGWGARYWAGV